MFVLDEMGLLAMLRAVQQQQKAVACLTSQTEVMLANVRRIQVGIVVALAAGVPMDAGFRAACEALVAFDIDQEFQAARLREVARAADDIALVQESMVKRELVRPVGPNVS